MSGQDERFNPERELIFGYATSYKIGEGDTLQFFGECLEEIILYEEMQAIEGFDEHENPLLHERTTIRYKMQTEEELTNNGESPELETWSNIPHLFVILSIYPSLVREKLTWEIQKQINYVFYDYENSELSKDEIDDFVKNNIHIMKCELLVESNEIEISFIITDSLETPILTNFIVIGDITRDIQKYLRRCVDDDIHNHGWSPRIHLKDEYGDITDLCSSGRYSILINTVSSNENLYAYTKYLDIIDMYIVLLGIFGKYRLTGDGGGNITLTNIEWKGYEIFYRNEVPSVSSKLVISFDFDYYFPENNYTDSCIICGNQIPYLVGIYCEDCLYEMIRIRL